MLRAVAIGIDLSSVTVVSRATGNPPSPSPEHAVESAICHLHCVPFLFSHPTWCQRITGFILSVPARWLALLGGQPYFYELWTYTCEQMWKKKKKSIVGCSLFFLCFHGRGTKKWLTACREGEGGGRGAWAALEGTYVGFFSFSSWWQWLMASSESPFVTSLVQLVVGVGKINKG